MLFILVRNHFTVVIVQVMGLIIGILNSNCVTLKLGIVTGQLKRK